MTAMKLFKSIFFLSFLLTNLGADADQSKDLMVDDDSHRSLAITLDPIIVGPSTIACGASATYGVHVQGTPNLFGDFDIDWVVKDSDLIWNDPLANGTASDTTGNPRSVIFQFTITCTNDCKVVGPDGPSGESTAEVFVNAHQQGTLFSKNSDNKSVTCVSAAPSASPTAAPTDSSTGGNGGGDPHFVTWDRTRYSFHGQCDLIMTQSPKFGNGKGLDLHIRTTEQEQFSFISGTALRIGKDILEIDSEGNHFINGQEDVELPTTIGGYIVAKQSEANKKFVVELDNFNTISIRSFKGFLYVTLSAAIPGSAGLLGTFGHPGMVGRDGTLLSDPNKMGASWQVTGMDAHLFRMKRGPQWPEACILPDLAKSARRLGENAALTRKAAEACAHIGGEMNAFCMFDVIQTGDVDLATQYGGDGF